MQIPTQHHIAGNPADTQDETFQALYAETGEPMPPAFPEATDDVVNRACQAAANAQHDYRAMTLDQRAGLLEAIADELDSQAASFAERTPQESGLPEGRVRGELGRTTGQLRLFADVVRTGHFLGARIDTAQPQRDPAPKPDVRQYFASLGPVAVFGASNFPLAFSVAGGDTASALAAGCPVVVKAHPGHPGTSALVASAIDRAVAKSGAPAGVFNMVHGRGNAVGAALVQHPLIRAVGFTGSFAGGDALTRLASARPDPIPVYAEMGSVNPLFLLPQALAQGAGEIAEGWIGSVTQGCGQFCTNPGLVFAASGSTLEQFAAAAADDVADAAPGAMLHKGILSAYESGAQQLDDTPGVELVAAGKRQDNRAQARLYRTTTAVLREQPHIRDEVFGPSAVLVEVTEATEFADIAATLPGQLTAGLFAAEGEAEDYTALVQTLENRAGRVLFNGFPTGVEVTHAMVHGGPFPATSDSRMTSVGTRAIERFLRPVCYQNSPDAVLPDALKNDNPLGLQRLVNGEWTHRSVKP